MDFSETIEIKVFDSSSPVHTPARSPGPGSPVPTPGSSGDHTSPASTMTIDSFFFAYFWDVPAALDQIRDAVRERRTTTDSVGVSWGAGGVLDTTTTGNAYFGYHPTATTTTTTATAQVMWNDHQYQRCRVRRRCSRFHLSFDRFRLYLHLTRQGLFRIRGRGKKEYGRGKRRALVEDSEKKSLHI